MTHSDEITAVISRARPTRILVNASRQVRAVSIRFTRKCKTPYLVWRFRRQASSGHLAIDFRNGIGFGARLIDCLKVLNYCDARGIEVSFRFSMPDKPGIDFFSPFFSISTVDNQTKCPRFLPTSTIRNVPYLEVDTLELGSKLSRQRLCIQPSLESEVNQFWDDHALGSDVLGVHYRGTDKSTEASAVTYDEMFESVNETLKDRPSTTAVFVTSDEADFVALASQRINHNVVVSRDDFRRAKDSRERFRDTDQVIALQRDAVVNMLLLARCGALVKMASFLSAFSVLLNPEMSVNIVNRTHGDKSWFPENQMIERQRDHSKAGPIHSN
jgi:hypothetical protein